MCILKDGLDMANLSKNDMRLCCGCTACVNICPCGAIHMKSDAKGFQYPAVDKSKCINCGQCVDVCQIHRQHDVIGHKESVFYAVNNVDDVERMHSKSGGVFPLLARNVITQNGSVYGAILNDVWKVVHYRSDTISDIKQFSKSKYVQSELGTTFADVKNDLQAGRIVLFSGTACQCAGLKKYLQISRTDISRLHLVDIICHGVPSPLVFSSYLIWLEKKNKDRISEYSFRDKEAYGWGKEIEKVVFRSGRRISSDDLYNVDYFWTVYKHELIRECCYSCPYAVPDRESDITIGDFWGLENATQTMNDKLGTSLVIVHSDCGQQLFNEIKRFCKVQSVDRENCLQRSLCKPSEKKEETERYWDAFISDGFDGLAELDWPKLPDRFKKKIKRLLGHK